MRNLRYYSKNLIIITTTTIIIIVYIYIYIYIYIYRSFSIMVRMFAYSPGNWVSLSDQVITKTKKWYLMPLCLILSIIRYVSRVSEAIQGKAWRLLLLLGVVAIEKRAFGSPRLRSLSYIYIYIYVTRWNLALIWKNKKKGEKKKRKKNGSYHFEFSTQNEKLVVHASALRRTSVCDKLTKKNTLINIQSERFPRGTKIAVSEPTKKI